MRSDEQNGDAVRVRGALEHVEHEIPPELRQGLEILLSESPDPSGALLRLERLCESHPGDFQQIAQTPFGLQSLILVFSYSQFLAESVLQHPDWLLGILASGWLHRMRTLPELQAELASSAPLADGSTPLQIGMGRFRRRQLLRIMLRDILGFAALPEVTEELSNVADAVIGFCYQRIRAELTAKHGAPRLADGAECGYSVLALGKLGGCELNYSSDIDLMFLYDGPGTTDGSAPVSNREFFKKVSTQLADRLGTYTPEGFCYRVDLRLRPEGRLGEVCITLDGCKDYYERRARDWELQMLIKARVAAGEPDAGKTFLDWVQPKIFSTSIDFTAIERMSETRERISEKLNARRRPAATDIKLARGGIRDIEFLVQCLQRVHGGRSAWIRNSSTLLSLVRLRDKDLLSDSEYSRLATAYQFLRHLEHRLQLDEDRQTHTLPDRPETLALAARRMPATLMRNDPSPENLLRQLNLHFEYVQEVYQRVIYAQQPLYYTQLPIPPAGAVELDEPVGQAGIASSNLIRFLDQRAPALAAAVGRARLGRSQAAFEHFLERALREQEWVDTLNADPVLCGYLIDLFQHSPYFAEQLIRHPSYFEEIRGMRVRGRSATNYADVMPLIDDANELRRYYLRQVFRIQLESICLAPPIFQTLARTSELADAVIDACYRISVRLTAESLKPATPGYEPSDQMMVVALGRLGMFEFDLGSDADLVFIIPDADLPELHFWTRVAERLMTTLASYTGDGVIFAVDARLCPNGKGGALVQSDGAYRDYFVKQAEAWEGMAYMKSRAVAGNIERATALLADLQKLDWRRYGQSGRSKKELRQMRLRIEREHGEGNPLKNAAGGYYDIDFALLYLRLRGAGMFFKVLNTPKRIEVVEQMGHLDSNDANFLSDAATFYRSVDHGLRLISGHTEGSLPSSESQLRMLASLVSRWTPEHLHDQPLELELRQIQDRTRDFFERLFGEN
ncbi:MAG TPA: glutamine-synthetase adenylyltransferase [Bryobacteraceae bacterium]|nr:glutamine-synthetase adenylyltransferase [Bryobacteraceae bacterium]